MCRTTRALFSQLQKVGTHEDEIQHPGSAGLLDQLEILLHAFDFAFHAKHCSAGNPSTFFGSSAL